MAVKFESINQAHRDFIAKQKMFVVGSAGEKGFINVSPKGMDSLRIIDDTTVVWVNYTGSGNETSAHIQENGRMTIMFNSFDKTPLILKLYGDARVIHEKDEKYQEIAQYFEPHVGIRQFFEMKIALVLTSCGYGVPQYEFIAERDTLKKWSDKKGREGIKAYWEEHNTQTLDGIETKIMQKSHSIQ